MTVTKKCIWGFKHTFSFALAPCSVGDTPEIIVVVQLVSTESESLVSSIVNLWNLFCNFSGSGFTGLWREILLLLNLFGIICRCFLFIEIFSHISNLLLCHDSDTPLCFAVTSHMSFFVTIVTLYWWALHPVSVNIHCVGIMQWWSLLLLLLLLPVWLQWVPKGLSQQSRWQWQWSWRLLCGGLPWCTLINFAIKGLFSPGNSPLMICPDCLIIPLFDSDWPRSQLSQMSPESLVQGSLELHN